MPQCIAQQDQSAWLSAMTACTWKRCTRHFGVICSHHQYLTQLSCLRAAFSPDLVRGYLPYCGRSVLATAQLYDWILHITGRTWFVDVGDAIEVQRLSPASLVHGYSSVDLIGKAPSCLTRAESWSSKEPFRRAMASCSFTSATQHMGNAARPWEYNQGLQSMTALDYETAGYSLTQHSITYGDYFDKSCFCKTFILDDTEEPCMASRRLDITRERLWMNATCGPKSLFANWTDNLMTTKSAYIAKADWAWPACVADMPKDVLELTDRCADDACKLDSSGYCQITSAVDRSCFCSQISYDSCKGSCHFFETRIDYVKWMHRLCGAVQDWHGLPQDWQRLANPTAQDMIPWQWVIAPHRYLDGDRMGGACASSDSMLGNIGLLNAAFLFAAFFVWRSATMRASRGTVQQSSSGTWVISGLSGFAVQLLGYWFAAYLIQSAPHFAHVPVAQLVLLFCTIPRPAWLKAALSGLHYTKTTAFPMAASALLCELILQCLTTYYMSMTAWYGYEHSFYWNYMDTIKHAPYAILMYVAAALWLSTSLVMIVMTIRILWTKGAPNTHPPYAIDDTTRRRTAIADFLAPFNEWYLTQEDALIRHWSTQSRRSHLALLASAQPAYGSILAVHHRPSRSRRVCARLGVVLCSSLLVAWIAQWLFWIGFLGLSKEMYVSPEVKMTVVANMSSFCIPYLGCVVAAWAAAPLLGDWMWVGWVR
jgi:hypothetical protein